LEPRIEIFPEKKLIGMQKPMSFAENKTGELWKNFMQRQKEINNKIGNDFYSIQIYGPDYFTSFDPAVQFPKWAAVEVLNFDFIPIGMEPFTLTGGLYAVFFYKGAASAGQKTFQYIFGTWLPKSGYALDNRPHFEILGERYKNEDPGSEEEIWVPLVQRT
jgi:AraC family transcriptional regulator